MDLNFIDHLGSVQKLDAVRSGGNDIRPEDPGPRLEAPVMRRSTTHQNISQLHICNLRIQSSTEFVRSYERRMQPQRNSSSS